MTDYSCNIYWSRASWRHLFAFILMFLTLNTALPGQVPTRALEKAISWIDAKSPGFKSNQEIQFDTIFNYKDSWIFERDSPEAFVVVKKERDYYIAGYSLDNKFLEEGIIPEPGKLCLDAIQKADMKEFSERQRLKTFPSFIEPLTTTRWGQDCYFNHACPTDYRGYCDHVPVGCVPVAMGQIMKFYGHFNKFVLEEKYESDIYPDETVVLGNYDWDKMEDDPVCIDHEVSKFLYHLGVISKVSYHYETTSTSTYNTWVAFGKLTYLESVRMVRGLTETSVWINEFYRNISEFMPIYVAGSGHAFVCDGYDEDGFFHFNLGWGGPANGYYPLIGTGAPFISEALLELRPHSLVLPPVNLKIKEGDIRDSLVWDPHPYAETLPFKYRIYQDDKEFDETDKTSYPADVFEDGYHKIKVSAWYVNGESRWIGPVEVFNKGNQVTIPDDQLRKSINRSIGLAENEIEDHHPSSDELLTVKSINCNEPVTNLRGIDYCKGLLELRISDNQGQSFDINKLLANKKLKILSINNAEVENLKSIGQFEDLVYLSLNTINLGSLDFISGNKDLLSLDLAENSLPAIDSLVNLQLLEHLDLGTTGLADIALINHLPLLKSIDFQNNNIEEFELDNKLKYLRFVNLNDNDIDEMKFIEEMPGLVHFRIANNNLPSLEIFKTFPDLELADFSGNIIQQIKINHVQPGLVTVDLSNNKIKGIERLIDSAPILDWLDVSDNEISTLWDRSIQFLKHLDISSNKLRLIEGIQLNPSLVHLDLANNEIGDFFPLIHNSFYENIEMLDISGNPASHESYQEFFPLFVNRIDSTVISDNYVPVIPSYPSPARYSNLVEGQVDLSWQSDNTDDSFSFDVYFGEPGTMELIAENKKDHSFSVLVDNDKRYQWQVVATNPDTSFSGGIYRFRTFTPIELPYYEGFENFIINDKISAKSPYWITKTHEYNSTEDGTIVGLRRFAGEKSLRLLGQTHLILPLDNFSGELLNFESSLLVEDGNIACFRITEISGIRLEVYFKVNRKADILVNGELHSSFEYETNKWIPVRISLNGEKSYISVYINGRTGFRMPWIFPKGIVELENIELSGENSPNFPTDGFPLYYIDELAIRQPGATTSGLIIDNPDELNIYPNPASEEIWLNGGPDSNIEKVYLLNVHGQRVKEFRFNHTSLPLRLNIQSLEAGMYWIYYQTAKGTGCEKIVITQDRRNPL